MIQKDLNIRTGSLLLFHLYAVPIIWWWLVQPDLDISTYAGVVRTIAKVSAIAAIISFSVSPLLSVRMGLTDKLFNGLDKSIKIHKKVGISSVVLGLAHPIFLTLYVVAMPDGTIWDVWSPVRLVVLLGLVGLAGSILVAAMTRLRKIRHQNWIRIHRLMGWFLLLIIGHLLLARGDAHQNQGLQWYLLGVSSMGFAAFLYQSVLSGWLMKRYRYEVVEVNKINKTVMELVMKPLGTQLHYNSGQYAYVELESDVVDRESHPFSFATHDNGPYIRFGIKALGDYTSKLRNLEPGTKALLHGPFGGFSYTHGSKDTQIWIAGGAGITPFLSLARSLSDVHEGKIILHYGFKDLDDAVFLKELQDIAKIRDDIFEVYIASEDLNGYVDIDKISATANDFKAANYLICGPPPMMKSVKKALRANGVSKRQIHAEEFSTI